ncbi:DUF4134 family protein [Mucilaginibacter sp. ZT4R22]|uniref:DUF4134 family protein n=1 Tax=Mucilaginibacter pankratovii TaxID=2772110 RepID=A0ABR7WJP8_9SPHI|nr:DUF4134 family protein [Mucilaginibacter pankratovii]MBD1362536.1 DUF4134 family protein [Mucilaginibacter pankratovii]
MKWFLTACCFLGWLATMAQPGIAEMQQAKQDLTASFFSAFDCSLVIATLVGLNGALKIYHNAQMGKDRVDSDVAAWFFAAIFITLAGAFLRALFGI